jgi:uncharacterized protein (DUF362 family)
VKDYTVRAVRCDHRASEEEIYATLQRLTAPLARSWEKLEAARTIVLKTNMVWPPERLQYFAGRRREHVDEAVFRGVLRLLRERTSARLIVADTTQYVGDPRPARDINFLPLLEEFGVEYLEANDPPFATLEVPGGGLMFQRYLLPACLAEADAVVSVAKLKNHGFMGVTMCLKNLFGLCPMPPHGRPRSYFHHLIRLPYVLPDLGLLTQPCLNLIDGLVGQARREWGGEGRICDALIAGDHVVATDACGAWLMGHDPASDWPTPPFKRDRNHLRVAAEHGFGTVNLDDIDFETDLTRPLAEFDSEETDPPERVHRWRQTMCQQALLYRDRAADFIRQYAHEFIFLQAGQVVWHGLQPHHLGSRRVLSGDQKDSALWLKWVDPEEAEGEHFEVYEQILAGL